MDPRDKVALVTGGKRIGKTVARGLFRHGCSLAMVYRRSQEEAEEVVAEARAAGVEAEAFQADASEERDVQDVVRRVVERLGRIDILVNMASRYHRVPFARLNAGTFSEAIDSDAKSTFLFSVACAPHMKQSGAGRIINFTDWLAVSERPRYSGYTTYYTAKATVIGLTESLALELAPDVLVNAIAPGPLLPPPDLSEDDNAKVIAATPVRRWGGSEEISKAVLFLIETEFVTGECLRVDGGRHLY